MEAVDKRFVLVAHNKDRLYPYKKRQEITNRYGFAITAPGEQDRKGQGTYTDDIQEVIKRVVFDGWSVRAKTTDKAGRQREGTFGIDKRSKCGYEVSEEFEHLVNSATVKPLSSLKVSSTRDKEKPRDSNEESSAKEVIIDEVTYQAIKTRRGQPEFRKALLQAYGGKCCVTQSEVESVLEVAHIVPHSEETNYSVSNGLLLRSDIHTLYDLNLIGVDRYGKVHVSESLKQSEYWEFQGNVVAYHVSEELSENLAKRYQNFILQQR